MSCSLLQNHQTLDGAKREVASEFWESYLDRPDILEITSQEHTDLMAQWSDLKRSENVQKYLAQEGISSETLEAGKKVLFIDTGFSGTIPRVLKEYFPAKYHEQLKTHLICSSNA